MTDRRTVARWIAPSVIGACAGALAGGVVEGLATAYLLPTIGLFALVAVPLGFVLALACRALVAGWQPGKLAARLSEDGGSMPRLLGWFVTIWLGAILLAWVTFQGTWLLAGATAFKPLAVGFIQPVIAVVTFLTVAALSRPLVAAVAAVARRIDARWRRRGRRTLLSSKVIFGAAVIGATASVYLVWRYLVRKRLGAFDTTVLHAPLIAAAVTSTVHLVWQRLGRARVAIGATIAGLAAIAIGIGVVTVKTQPSDALEIWGARPVAGRGVAWFDLEAVRDAVPIGAHAPMPKLGAPHPDIVLVTIEGLRADRTPPYGHPVDAPVLRELGVRGAVYAYAFSPSNEPERSLPSMLTGTAPNRISDDPRHVTLAVQLRDGGYDTAGFLCCTLERRWRRGLEHVTVERDGARLADAAHAWMAERRKRGATRPLFLWVHLAEPSAWAPIMGMPLHAAERVRLYDHAVINADRALARVLSSFSERPPIVIVTSDHGEGLGDHGQLHHGTDLYNSQIRVPFVIAGPGIRKGPIQETVSGTDLTPTILELAGFLPPKGPSIDGRSVADLAFGTRVSMFGGGNAFSIGEQTAIVQGRWKLIEVGPVFELFDVIADPDEASNHVTVRPDLVIELRKVLDARQAGAKRSPFR